ncbi:MAG TPA: AI-2E family transporter [Anaerolineales bacterium]|nr:AI-2E family transporter [Anaerolineales bacterium]
MKRWLLVVGLVLFTLGVLFVLWQFRLAILLFVFSLIAAAIVRPVARILTARGVPHLLSILLVYFIGLLSLAVLAWVVSGALFREFESASDRFSGEYERIVEEWPQGTSFQRQVAQNLPEPSELYSALAGDRGISIFRTGLGLAQGLLSVLGQFFVVVVLSIYWSIDQARFERFWLSLLPVERRAEARDIWRSIELGVSSYMRSELVQSLISGVLLWIGYRLIGLEYPMALALLGALLVLIPWLGPVLSVGPPLFMGLLFGWPTAALAVGYTLLVQLVMEFIVEPRFFDRRSYSSLLVAIVLVGMGQTFGLIGIMLAPPLAAALQILAVKLIRLPGPDDPVEPALQIVHLQHRMDQIREDVAALPTAPPPPIANLLERLDSVMTESCELLLQQPEEA